MSDGIVAGGSDVPVGQSPPDSNQVLPNGGGSPLDSAEASLKEGSENGENKENQRPLVRKGTAKARKQRPAKLESPKKELIDTSTKQAEQEPPAVADVRDDKGEEQKHEQQPEELKREEQPLEQQPSKVSEISDKSKPIKKQSRVVYGVQNLKEYADRQLGVEKTGGLSAKIAKWARRFK